ncbi:IS66 family insertion sequence element accessory protein TnpB [Pseudomonas lactucae]|uniref:IS66 family insertion sequence element accessory protein TnpB n=1 Tax=Pseudomonas lactucae TaxID=2813360 RepID=UPI002FCD19CE
MIRIDVIWLATEPMDMRAGTETALARMITGFGAAKPHCAYLFANRRANRMKELVHDCVGVWLAARRLNQGIPLAWHSPWLRGRTRQRATPGVGTGPAVAARWRRRCD